MGVVAKDVDGIRSMLEAHHSHFIICPGSNWGDESEWIAASARALAGSMPVTAILINGGKIAWNDAEFNIKHKNQILIAEGTGRTADIIATTSTGFSFDKQAMVLLRTGKVHIANFFTNPAGFIEKLSSLMK
jgi:hypothetical protein